MPNAAVQLLLARQGPDGGWGAYANLPSRSESTALGTLALRRAEASESDPAVGAAARAGAAWLQARQLPSGAWPVGDDVPGSSWTTGLAALALSHFGSARPAAREGAAWLLGQRGRGSPRWVRWLYFLAPEKRPVELDPELTGWAWVDGSFSWVEPTSYAVLALRRLGDDLGDRRTRDRIEEAERLLEDRVCADGGWNYGNSRVLGEELSSYPDTTALALLALAGAPYPTLIEGGLEALASMPSGYDSVLSLGLTALAFGLNGADPGPTRSRIREHLGGNWNGENRALAWAALGLLEADDPLGLRS